MKPEIVLKTFFLSLFNPHCFELYDVILKFPLAKSGLPVLRDVGVELAVLFVKVRREVDGFCVVALPYLLIIAVSLHFRYVLSLELLKLLVKLLHCIFVFLPGIPNDLLKFLIIQVVR